MFDFDVSFDGNTRISVVASNLEDAQRILRDTIDNITIKDIKDKLTNRKDVKIKRSDIDVIANLKRQKDRGAR